MNVKENFNWKTLNSFAMISFNNGAIDVFYSRPEKLTEESMTGCLKTLNFINSFGLDI
jgi:hypothetical protein